jgi:hypothetical protein
MGARPPLETDRLSAARYGTPVVKPGVTLLLVVLLAACSGGSGAKKGGGNGSGACPLIAKLDQTAARVGAADVSDPEAFERTLGSATDEYVETLHELKAHVPVPIQADLERVEAAVHQGRYADALAARASLDRYAATVCGRVVTTTTSPATVTTTTAQ